MFRRDQQESDPAEGMSLAVYLNTVVDLVSIPEPLSRGAGKGGGERRETEMRDRPVAGKSLIITLR